MSKYMDNKDCFLEPQVNQYGRNMVMTNVTRETKHKFIGIDTRFSDEYNASNYTITLPERLTNVKSMSVRNVEIPMTFYNISSSLGNNYFSITASLIQHILTIPDGQYTSTTLTNAINTQIQSLGVGYNVLVYNVVNNKSTFDCSTNSVTIDFDTDSNGSFDKYNFKSKLGWLLGFRKQSYVITTALTTSECIVDLLGPKYLYLVIDEFSQKNPNSFLSPQSGFLLSKNILARISMDDSFFPFGKVLPANNHNGYLLTDQRSYNGTIDIKKLNVQVVNEIGIPIDFNGIDFSFCLEVVHE